MLSLSKKLHRISGIHLPDGPGVCTSSDQCAELIRLEYNRKWRAADSQTRENLAIFTQAQAGAVLQWTCTDACRAFAALKRKHRLGADGLCTASVEILFCSAPGVFVDRLNRCMALARYGLP